MTTKCALPLKLLVLAAKRNHGPLQRRLVAAIALFGWVAKTMAAAALEEGGNIAVYAGSKGTGVRKEALAKIDEVERFLALHRSGESTALVYRRSKTGLEGEVLLCIEPPHASGREALFADLQRITEVEGTISVRPSRCSARSTGTGKER